MRLKIFKSSAGKYIMFALVAGVIWKLAQTLTDDDLEARVFPRECRARATSSPPDFSLVHQELERAAVTLQLLWEE